jgi:hypothetical protein
VKREIYTWRYMSTESDVNIKINEVREKHIRYAEIHINIYNDKYM